MSGTAFRAIAILKAKEGSERALQDFTLDAAREIRGVEGLHRLEISRALSDPGQLILYYWWESAAHSRRYIGGRVYAKIAPRLEALVEEHLLVVGDLLSE